MRYFGIGPSHGERAYIGELVDTDVTAEISAVFHCDMTRKYGMIAQCAVIAHFDIMPHVNEGHEHAFAANGSLRTFPFSSMDGDVLADDRVVAYPAVALFVVIVIILRSIADNGVRMNLDIIANGGPAVDIDAGTNAASVTYDYFILDYRVGADMDVFPQFYIGADYRSFMYHGFSS